MHPAVSEALIAERVRERQAAACLSRRAQAIRRARRRPSSTPAIVEGQFPCPPATQLRSA
ncbi:MAG TPA: hypothetical protein VG123_17255 [Streptosporangiaceae bacterium]|jgi:hypothetical protein|nr:hypothetical protein [Streptosporangiaceae bacterium]